MRPEAVNPSAVLPDRKFSSSPCVERVQRSSEKATFAKIRCPLQKLSGLYWLRLIYMRRKFSIPSRTYQWYIASAILLQECNYAMIKVYLAAPYTKDDVAINVHNVIEVADQLLDKGFAPFVPHLTHFWHLIKPRPYKDWLKLDNEFLPLCDCVLRLKGESKGADREVKLAYKIGLLVFHDIEKLLLYYAL